MYNGIGLSTVRGSATSGYVTANSFNAHRRNTANRPKTGDEARPKPTGPNAEVLEHNRKRELELKVFEYRVGLEDDEVDDDEIERRVAAFRARLLEEEEARGGRGNGDGGNVGRDRHGGGTHEAAARKEHDMEKLADAFGVSREGYREGAAFTSEYHDAKREQAREEREKAREEREKAREEREKAREEREKAREAGEQLEELDARLRALDEEMDVMKREREKALLEARREREEGEEEEDGEEEEEEVSRKRARHDSDSDSDGEADDRDDREDSKETNNVTDVARAEGAAAEEVPAQQPDDREEATPAKTLLDVVLSLFTEQETLRKKEIVAAAESSGVEFKDSEYSKLMKQIATSKPGGKWVKNE